MTRQIDVDMSFYKEYFGCTIEKEKEKSAEEVRPPQMQNLKNHQLHRKAV